ncbi:hypothetical protein ACTL6U_00520 [Rhodovibrionaceae bacterium A322]
MKSVIVAVSSLFMLSGCVAAIPPAISVASLALDTGSYMVSGKTVTDHGLSAMLEGDCSLVRVLEKGTFCAEEQDYQLASAVLEPLPDDATLELAEATVVRHAYVTSLVPRDATEDFTNFPSEPWIHQSQEAWVPPSDSQDSDQQAELLTGTPLSLNELAYVSDDMTPVESGLDSSLDASSGLSQLGFLSDTTLLKTRTLVADPLEADTSLASTKPRLLPHSQIDG